MRPYILLAIIGIIVAALAALAVRSTVEPNATTAEAPRVETTRILVARETIPAGRFVRHDSDLGWGEWPAAQVQAPPYITESAAKTEDYNGAVARRTIFAGEPITQGAMVKPGEGGFMSAVLQPGMRAVSLPVNATTGNAGFIFPGDSVDLILTHAIQNLTGQSFASETFVEDVRVLAVDQMLDNPENKALLAKTVTLEVQPRQAEAINVALEMGKISLVLRSLATEEQTEDSTEPDTSADTYAPIASGMQRFYPDNIAIEPERHYTRDSDISRLIGGGGDAGQPTRVRVIRGDTTTELEFRPSVP
jgi:pilus assembly protein CpaB